MNTPTTEEMRAILVDALQTMPNSDIYELAACFPLVDDAPITFALATLEGMERDGLAERVGRSMIHPRNYVWRLTQ